MTLLSILDLVGRMHPVVVHLPIGILLISCIILLLAQRPAYQSFKPAVSFLLFWGMVCAIFACFSGYILSQSGDYDGDLVTKHQWFGISLAVISVLLYFFERKNKNRKLIFSTTSLLLLLVFITGHLGGSITHGSNYLAAAFDGQQASGPAIPPIADVQDAKLYEDAIRPLFQSRCYSCHGPDKKKGKLRLDSPEMILAGGEDGKAIVPGHTDEGELMKRILLPLNNEDHMPPKEKSQLTKYETDLLAWWIETGADFTKRVKQLPQPEKIKPVLASLQAGETSVPSNETLLPEQPVSPADADILKKLKETGVNPVPMATNSNYLSLSVVSAIQPLDSIIKLLPALKDQLLYLNLGFSSVNDTNLVIVGGLLNLRRLSLNNTDITDNGIANLKKLENLEYLNFSGTGISLNGLKNLQALQKLKNLYLYGANVHGEDWNKLKQLFPKASVDTGGYVVPTLVTDTTKVTLPK